MSQLSSKPLVSVIIPTYNSEDTLNETLKALRMQNIPQEEVEILVIDGGSTDKTLEIARKYNVLLFDNPRRLPAYAIELGMQKANGHYLIRTASDEALLHADQLKKRIDFLEENKDIQCMCSNRQVTPKFDRHNFSRSYMNRFGDPFTAFVYRTKGSIIESFKKNIVNRLSGDVYVLKVEKDKPYPIMDGAATLISLDYAREHFAVEMNELDFLIQITEQIAIKTGLVACIKGDDVLHTSKTSYKGYLKKIKYRIINNIFDIKISGYTNVAKQVPILNKRKYQYVFYCLSVICPIIHSFYYSFKYSDVTLMMHFVYAEYTFIMVCYYMLRKCLKLPVNNKLYG